MENLIEEVVSLLDFSASLFLFALGIGVAFIMVLYIIDRFQTTHAIRRNYPLIGRFRYLFEYLGEYFRQYFFALDREEMPFNRAQRSWVYRASKGVDATIAFGSTHDIRPTGSVLFVNCPFPKLKEDTTEPQFVTIGPHCPHPYKTKSIFNISGMSFGAISKPAVQALSNGARMAGCWMNTGEGGLSPYHVEGGADIVFQIGTAKYGVRDEDGHLSDKKLATIATYNQVKMFEIKLSQGAKPGIGGILPAAKVTPEIAAVRGIEVGEASLSPNRHPEIDNAEQLLDMIHHVRTHTGKPTGFKMVIGAYGWLDELCEAIIRRGPDESAPDFITLDSGDGGTGAAPMALMDSVGLPIRETLPMLVDILSRYDLRERIKIIAGGKLINPADVAWAYCIGADFVISGRGFMFALGCIQALQCNKNTCPTGITTHSRRLQKGLNTAVKAERVRRYAEAMTRDVCTIAHSCGVSEPRALRRYHVRMIGEDGYSRGFHEIYPEVTPEAQQSKT
ncbi:MAG: FMN-binding glutamate synthase family protein [Parvularculales bacterium]